MLEYTPEAAKFYYAYCSTEKKRLGGPTSDETVARNTADYHERQTHHEVDVVYE